MMPWYPQKLGGSLACTHTQGCILQNPDIFLKDFFTRHQQVQVIDGVPLPLNPNGFLPVSQEKYPVLTLPMGGRRVKSSIC